MDSNLLARIRRDTFWKGKSCLKCGSTTKLELDHIERGTKDAILCKHPGDIWHWSNTRRDLELAKCQVLCKICHREKSNSESRGINTPWNTKGRPFIERVKYLRSQGLSMRKIAKKVNLGPSTIFGILHNQRIYCVD